MSLKKLTAAAAVATASLTVAAPAQAGAEPYLGEIIPFGFNFCPRGYAAANGQFLSIAQNQALFALLGTTYGGNGQTTFALPDLRSRTAVGDAIFGGGSYQLGQSGGSESFTVTAATMPAHNHTGALRAVSAEGDTNDPTGNSMARALPGVKIYSTVDPANNMSPGDVVIGSTGSGAPVPLTSPALTMNYCIALQGIFPSRN